MAILYLKNYVIDTFDGPIRGSNAAVASEIGEPVVVLSTPVDGGGTRSLVLFATSLIGELDEQKQASFSRAVVEALKRNRNNGNGSGETHEEEKEPVDAD